MIDEPTIEELRAQLSESQAALLVESTARQNIDRELLALQADSGVALAESQAKLEASDRNSRNHLTQLLSTQLAYRRLRDLLERTLIYELGPDLTLEITQALSAPSDEQLIDRVVEDVRFGTRQLERVINGEQPNTDTMEAEMRFRSLITDLKGAANDSH